MSDKLLGLVAIGFITSIFWGPVAYLSFWQIRYSFVWTDEERTQYKKECENNAKEWKEACDDCKCGQCKYHHPSSDYD